MQADPANVDPVKTALTSVLDLIAKGSPQRAALSTVISKTKEHAGRRRLWIELPRKLNKLQKAESRKIKAREVQVKSEVTHTDVFQGELDLTPTEVVEDEEIVLEIIPITFDLIAFATSHENQIMDCIPESDR